MENFKNNKPYDIAKIMRVAFDQYLFLLTPCENKKEVMNFEK